MQNMTPQHHTLVTKLKVNQALNIGKTDIPILNFLDKFNISGYPIFVAFKKEEDENRDNENRDNEKIFEEKLSSNENYFIKIFLPNISINEDIEYNEYFDCEKAINIIKKFITIDNTNYTNYTT